VEYPRAAVWYQHAAEAAFEGNDLEAALAASLRGLLCVEDPESQTAAALMMVRTKASRWLGKLQDAEEAARWAMRLFPRGSASWCEAAAEAVHVSGKLGHEARLVEHTEALLALSEVDLTDREVAASYAIALARAATNVQLSCARKTLVEVLLERAEEAAEQAAGDPAVVGQVQWARSLRALAAGDVSSFLALVEASRASLELAGDLRSECVQAINAGHGFLLLGLFEQAAHVLRETMARAERLGLGHPRAYAKLHLGPALAGLGRLAQARAAVEEAIALLHRQADRPQEAIARAYLAIILASSGERDAAAREALGVAADRGATPATRALARAVLAGVLLSEGRGEEALVAAEIAHSILTALDGIEEGESRIRLVYAETLAATGDHAGARTAIREARDLLLARAAKVVDPLLRQSFLDQVPENARTLARAREWLGD
jgi:tetratricopeptide (TPR) repeat protein